MSPSPKKGKIIFKKKIYYQKYWITWVVQVEIHNSHLDLKIYSSLIAYITGQKAPLGLGGGL